jgi:cytochrome P450
LKGEPPRIEDLAQLPLLERVVKESLRILPPVPFNHRISAEDTELGGYAVPRGTELIASIYRTQRMPELFPEGDRFRPERWENLDPGPYAYSPFGAGPRMCIGATFALMEVRIVLAMLLQTLRVELAPNARIDRFISITMAPKHGLPMHLHPPDRHFPRTPTPVRGNIHQMVALA